ncbi:MAG: ABC transporter substrate-binding protein, partial [Chloroflexota bacterium]
QREDALPIVENTPELKYVEFPQSAFYNLGWRMDKPELPFKDLNVRRALLMGINQQEIVDTYYSGHGAIVPQTVLPGWPDLFKDVWTPIEELPPSADGFDNRKMFGYYPEEARQMLADAGYPNGFKYSVTMYDTPNYTDHMQMAKAYWEKIGVNMELDVKEYGTWSSIYQTRTQPEALLCGRWGGEPYSAFCVRKGNRWNWGMVDNPIFDDYYDQMTALYFKPKERDAVMKKMNLDIIDYAPYYMLPVGTYYNLWWPWVKNFDGIYSLGLGGYYFEKYMWIDEDLKKSMGY